MGGCVSVENVPGFRPRPFPRYYPIYRQGVIDLAKATAGTRGEPDYHVRLKYEKQIDDLKAVSRVLVADYERIRYAWEHNGKIRQECKEMSATVSTLQAEYESLFRWSAWNIDNKVDERKVKASRPYFQLQILKDYLHDLGRGLAGSPHFKFLETSVRHQVTTSVELDAEYKEAQREHVPHFRARLHGI